MHYLVLSPHMYTVEVGKIRKSSRFLKGVSRLENRSQKSGAGNSKLPHTDLAEFWRKITVRILVASYITTLPNRV